MKRRKIYGLLGVIVIITLLAAACAKGSKEDSKAYDNSTSNTSYSGTMESTYTSDGNAKDMDFSESITEQEAPAEDNGKSKGLNSTSTITSGESGVQTQDKIIRTFYLDVETQEFDSLITKVNAEIKRLNGYVESSDINGRGYYNNGSIRHGSIVARVPSDKVDEFVGTVKEKANVVSQEESSENVSLKYIEAESRIETLRIEQERLYAILEQELNLENIITLESRLSNIRYELQNYESQIRYYDNQVAYSTVTLSIAEVEKYTPVVEVKQTLSERIQNGLSDTMYNLTEAIQNFIVWFVVNLPYLIIWGIIIAVVVIITRRSVKKRSANKGAIPTTPLFYGQTNQDNNTNQQNQDPKN